MRRSSRWFAIKAEVRDPNAHVFVFDAQKTMYGGKYVTAGDSIFIFASENEGGCGLVARGIVTAREGATRTDAVRQTPRVSVIIERTGSPANPLGRDELRAFRDRTDVGPEAELDFKFYRQATNKIIGLTDPTGKFLNGLF